MLLGEAAVVDDAARKIPATDIELTMHEPTTDESGATELRLLQRFELRRAGRTVAVPESVQRLVAYLALCRRPQHRLTVAGTLWMDSDEEHASANLRTAIWRARRLAPDLVVVGDCYLHLGPSIDLDITHCLDCAHQLLGDPTTVAAPEDGVALLSHDILPNWYDDWVVFERERVRQLRLHGLDALCEILTRTGRYGLAIEAGLVAAASDPLRESTQRALVATHLAEGNVVEALRRYDSYAEALGQDFGVQPTAALRSLVADWR